MKKKLFWCVLLLLIILMGISIISAQTGKHPYQNPQLSTEVRVNDLLSRMMLEEKIDQINMKSLSQLKVDSFGNVTDSSLIKLFNGKSIGCLESPFIHIEDIAKFSEAADKYLRENTRLGIPAIQIAECLHGQLAHGATIYPQSIALGSTWNPELIKEMGAVIAEEASATGVDQALSPLFDLARDPRFGRVEECYGECPELVAQMGVAFVLGMQGETDKTINGIPEGKIACTAKHFAGYSVPLAGINIAPSSLGERELRTLHLTPFERAVKEANIYAVMPSYNEVDGVPAHSNDFLLKQVLRKEWGFTGYVFSDYGGIWMLKNKNFTAKDHMESGIQAIKAGVDLEAPGSWGYKDLKEAVETGKLDIKFIDQAVTNILRAKFKMGLFDRPYTMPESFEKTHRTKEHTTLAQKIAEESIILLNNRNNILPLNVNKLKSIAVIGPNANQVQYGDYSSTKNNNSGITILEGIKEFAGKDVEVNYAKGCAISGSDKSGFGQAIETAKKSEVVVLVVGGTSATLSGIGWGDEEPKDKNTCGEGFDRTTLTFPGVQSDLIKSIHATGKPVILVMVHGRAYSIPWEKENLPAILEAWYPGQEGGTAIANILFGKVNPSGRLSVSVPKSVGHVPVTHDYKPVARGYYLNPGSPENPGRDYVFSTPEPLFEFGFGLSYTTFEYTDLKVEKDTFQVGEPVALSVTIKNTGTRKGKEVVQLYVNDKISSTTTPLKALKDFKKVELEPGETTTVTFHLDEVDFSLWNKDMVRIVESGEFEIMIGRSSEKIELRKTIVFN